MSEEVKKLCSKCEDFIHCQGKGCAFRSLSNEYCDEVENVNKLINNLQNDLDASNSRAKELSERIIKAIEYIKEYTELVPFNEDGEGGGLSLCDYDVANVLEILKGEPNNENRS